MFAELLQLIVLFFVLFDPLASLMVFLVSTQHMGDKDKRKTATLAILVAFGLSFAVLIFGDLLLKVFDTSIPDLRVAGGIILGILGMKMALGHSVVETVGGDKAHGNSSLAIASIIGTPLLTGPATITTIMISVADYGRLEVGIAIILVLLFTAAIFFNAQKVQKTIGQTAIGIISTVLGLITLAWAVKFIRIGLGI